MPAEQNPTQSTRKLSEAQVRRVADEAVELVADMLGVADDAACGALDDTLGAALEHELRQVKVAREDGAKEDHRPADCPACEKRICKRAGG